MKHCIQGSGCYHKMVTLIKNTKLRPLKKQSMTCARPYRHRLLQTSQTRQYFLGLYPC